MRAESPREGKWGDRVWVLVKNAQLTQTEEECNPACTMRKYVAAHGNPPDTVRKYAGARGHTIDTRRDKYAFPRGHTIDTTRESRESSESGDPCGSGESSESITRGDFGAQGGAGRSAHQTLSFPSEGCRGTHLATSQANNAHVLLEAEHGRMMISL